MSSLPQVFAVIGAGQMGAGIAQTAAVAAKIPRVILYDTQPAQLTKQLEMISTSLKFDNT